VPYEDEFIVVDELFHMKQGKTVRIYGFKQEGG